MLVRYEDFASNPLASAKEIFNFLRWEFEESHVLQERPEGEQQEPRSDLVPYYSTFRDLWSFDPNHWKQDLSRDDIRVIQDMVQCKNAMTMFKYNIL